MSYPNQMVSHYTTHVTDHDPYMLASHSQAHAQSAGGYMANHTGYVMANPYSGQQQTVSRYLLSRLNKFNAGRSFDIQDDLEFCPACTAEDASPYRQGYSGGVRSNSSSPLAGRAISSSPNGDSDLYPGYAGMDPFVMNGHMHSNTPVRLRRPIDIVDPNRQY